MTQSSEVVPEQLLPGSSFRISSRKLEFVVCVGSQVRPQVLVAEPKLSTAAASPLRLSVWRSDQLPPSFHDSLADSRQPLASLEKALALTVMPSMIDPCGRPKLKSR